MNEAPHRRKIRFAPLPDPRRTVSPALDGAEIALPDSPEQTTVQLPRSPLPLPSPAASPAAKTTPLPSVPPSSFSKPSSTWPKSLLRSFRKGNTPASSTDSLTPTPSLDTTPDVPSLQRWSSGTSATIIGSPLARTQSQTSTSSKRSGRSRSIFSIGSGDKRKPRTGSVPPPLNPFSNSVGTKRGTRMLNGRVYGSRNADGTHNPFGNARDDDPEFVEWGYGGMGSVRHGVGSSAWKSVQAGGAKTNGSSTKGEVYVGMGVVGDGDEDDDDGTGMGWVRRRREAREREAREREEKEKQAQEKDQVSNAEGERSSGSMEEDGLATPTATEPRSTLAPAASDISTPLATPMAPHNSSSLAGTPTLEGEHDLRAVTLPAGFRGHHHSHSHSHGHHRSSSNALNGIGSPGVHVTAAENRPEAAPTPSSGSDSESDSDSDEDDDESKENKTTEDEDDDYEEDTDEEQNQRVTALGAGVEKISRHKE
ncbi:hypothetical protein MIND_00733500 [Mycena indigotica]|uniref:Uncharacterized protein n=1 Tax=Mycena indigotica TaxID=2126181 RepID=A0A8H6SMP3_9AGAR|nr:uncharacterized protein MIND_00733500 [Mycena indigotica]KAF7301680.1 hypothetical protein MIND_00733500 [Mycena indigotica]